MKSSKTFEFGMVLAKNFRNPQKDWLQWIYAPTIPGYHKDDEYHRVFKYMQQISSPTKELAKTENTKDQGSKTKDTLKVK